jgi:hypothetical protein
MKFIDIAGKTGYFFYSFKIIFWLPAKDNLAIQKSSFMVRNAGEVTCQNVLLFGLV